MFKVLKFVKFLTENKFINSYLLFVIRYSLFINCQFDTI